MGESSFCDVIFVRVIPENETRMMKGGSKKVKFCVTYFINSPKEKINEGKDICIMYNCVAAIRPGAN